jgi:hypothetical protein
MGSLKRDAFRLEYPETAQAKGGFRSESALCCPKASVEKVLFLAGHLGHLGYEASVEKVLFLAGHLGHLGHEALVEKLLLSRLEVHARINCKASKLISCFIFVFRIVYTSAGFYIWTGKLYERALDVKVLYILMHQLSTVIDRVKNDLHRKLKRATDKEKVAEIEQRLRQLRDYNNSRAAEGTLRVTKGEMFSSTFLSELDCDPHILNVNNGVINLRTGKLDIHRPQYKCSKIANTNYRVSLRHALGQFS